MVEHSLHYDAFDVVPIFLHASTNYLVV